MYTYCIQVLKSTSENNLCVKYDEKIKKRFILKTIVVPRINININKHASSEKAQKTKRSVR